MRQMLKEKGAKIQGRTLQLLKKYVELRDRHRTAMRSAAVPSSSGKGNSKVNLARAARERAVSSDYAEMQVISQLQAVEQLKTLVKLPNQIIDPSEKRSQILPSDNGLVDDPVADLQLAKLREQWTPAECRIFLEKFQQFPKVCL